jgi:cytochrome c-type biogenesis protein CcmH/NrfG
MSGEGSRRRRFLAVALLALLAAGAVAAWRWSRVRPPIPPVPDLTEVDPEVATLLGRARRGVEEAPRSAEAWGRLGMALRAHGFGGEANTCFAEAERLGPGEVRWPYLHGLTLVLTDPDAGLPYLERAVELAGEAPEPRLRMVEVLLEQGRLDEAGQQLDCAGDAGPRASLGRVRLALARGRWREALRVLDEAGLRDDLHARRQAHHLAAQAWQRLDQADRAAAELARARAWPEDIPWPDRFVEQVEQLRVGVRVRLAWAEALLGRGEVARAVAVLEEVVRDRPEHAAAWLLLGRTLARERRPGAERALARVVELEPDSVEGWFQLGVARAHRRDPHGAREAFGRAVNLKPDYTLGHYNLGLCAREQGDRAAARAAFRAALRCQPDFEPARRALAALE